MVTKELNHDCIAEVAKWSMKELKITGMTIMRGMLIHEAETLNATNLMSISGATWGSTYRDRRTGGEP